MIGFGLTEEKVQTFSSNQASQEHILAKKEIPWASVISAIIRSALIIALYFFIEAWFLEPKLREAVTANLQDKQIFYNSVDVEQLVDTILNVIRIPLIAIEIISLILNLLVRARQILYVTKW